MPVGEEKVRAFDSCLFLAQITTIRPAGGLVVMGGDHILKVVGLNPGAVNWMGITFFSH